VVFTGGVDRNTFDLGNQKNSDSLTAHVLGSPNAVAPFNTIHESSIDTNHVITGTISYNSQAVGDMVCTSGQQTNTVLCGIIEQKAITGTVGRFDGDSLTLTNQIQMSRGGLSGDSGAPVYNGGTKAMGIGVAVNFQNGHVVYSAINHVAADMLITICVTAAC
jgi:hypothetical protein